jgi:xanthine dehydrogenase YagS FAD-binding subunit
VAAGAVAPTPRRLTAVEEALLSRPPTPIEEAAAAATEGARPLPLTRYKLEMLPALVADVLEAAMAGEPSGELAFGESGLGWPNG